MRTQSVLQQFWGQPLLGSLRTSSFSMNSSPKRMSR
uniref:Uncharacterized protein n=1 Tax=Rhizophora mucronata TaxID=61149 RepID=A0A2P2P490_RHIMU